MDNRIANYFEGKMSVSERIAFLRETEKDDNLKKEFINYRNMLGLIALADKDNDRIEGRQSYNKFRKDQVRQVMYRKFLQVLSYAAVIALLVGGTYFFTLNIQKSDIVDLAQNKIYVPAGQRANILLSDGTEAFFKVAHNEKKPFIVSTDNLDVKVLGTTFDVSAYKESGQTSVSLLEGSVKVQMDDKDVILSPKEVLYYDKEKTVVEKLDNENNFSWRYGILTFEDESLFEILKKLELCFHVEIIIKNSKLNQKTFTGKFRQRDGIMDILKILQRVHPFKIERDELNNVIIIE